MELNIKTNVVKRIHHFRVKFPDGAVTVAPVEAESREAARLILQGIADEDGFIVLPDREGDADADVE